MEITTESSIDITESLASYLLASHIHNNLNNTSIFEKRLTNVKTGKYSIADVYIPEKNTAIEVKSVAHGSSALKGVLQASMYKEAVSNSVFCMQKPRRDNLRNTIEHMTATHGVGLIWISGIPTICDEETLKSATDGCSKPFQLWQRGRYTTTKKNIIARSDNSYIKEYLDTLDSIVCEEKDSIFNFVVKPDPNVGGLSEVY